MDIVRKKAISALHRLYQMDKSCVVDHNDKIRRMLCDKDPAVMGAALPLIIGLVQESPSSFKDLVPSLVSILKQITEHRLPRDFDYHRIPAPWIQVFY
jgi:AP-4 complex subunit epsilon-1